MCSISILLEICTFCKVKTKWQVEILKETYFPSQQEGVGDRGGFPHNRIDSIGIGQGIGIGLLRRIGIGYLYC